MVAKQVVRTTEQLGFKGIQLLVAELVDDILECANQKARVKARSIVYNVVEQILLDLLSRELMEEILANYIVKYFDTTDTAYRVGQKLLSTNSFMAPIATFIQHSTRRVVAA